MKALIATAVLTLAVSSLTAAGEKETIFTPEGWTAAVCDREAKTCFDQQGISLGLIEEAFGAAAARKVGDDIGKIPEKAFDRTVFTMTGGVTCKTKEERCYVDKWSETVDERVTKLLFPDAR